MRYPRRRLIVLGLLLQGNAAFVLRPQSFSTGRPFLDYTGACGSRRQSTRTSYYTAKSLKSARSIELSTATTKDIDPATVQEIGGYPGLIIRFDEEQKLVYPERVNEILDFLQKNKVTDVWITVHGWLTENEDALERYNVQYEYVRQQAGTRLEGRRLGVVGVLWPSNEYACGGSDCHTLVKQLESLKNDGYPSLAVVTLQKAVEDTIQLKDNLEEDPDAREKLKAATRQLMEALQNLFSDDKEPVANELGQVSDWTVKVLDQLESVAQDELKSWLDGLLVKIANLLDITTYFKMMERSEQLGRKGLAPILQAIKKECPEVRLHLAGNSFGALSITAAAVDSPPASYASLVLLQGAFSHNAFADRIPNLMDKIPELMNQLPNVTDKLPDEMVDKLPNLNDKMPNLKDKIPDITDKIPTDYKETINEVFREIDGKPGEYRRVIDESVILGPIVVTYSRQDDLLHVPYAVASRFQGNTGLALPSMMMEDQFRLGLGGPDDEFGAMGRNGAQNLEEVHNHELKESESGNRQRYNLQDGAVVNNVDGSSVIQDHSDIRTEHIADLLIETVAATNRG